jgi:prepilin-type N-terminal cleavage/methylation domain-containing protein
MVTRIKKQAGFTLLEVMVSGAILAFSSFAFLALLQQSNAITYQARLDGKLSTLTRARLEYLAAMPFSQFVWVVQNGNGGSAFASTSTGIYFFQKGLSLDEGVNSTEGFPFVTSPDPFGPVNVYPYAASFLDAHYLLESNPYPGESQRNVFPYTETVRLTFTDSGGACASSSASSVSVLYTVQWRDDFSEGQPIKNFQFNFIKRDDATDL